MKGQKLLLVILLVAVFLRFYKLDAYPVSLSWDEAAIGYNAYSIAQTAKDEYGQKLPVLFKSFNDYKLPGYIYIDSIFIKLLGLSEFSTRLPSALFGILAVLLIYALTKKLFQDSSLKNIALLAMFFTAINPWHLQLSRVAFEANVALSVVLGGMVMLLWGRQSKIWALLSIPVLASSIYFYYSPRIFVPAILIIFFLIFRKEILPNLKSYLIGFGISIMILIPMITAIFSSQGTKRIREVSIFANRALIIDYVDARATSSNFLSGIFLNRRVPISFEALHNYLSHFSFGFLFFGDDPNPRHRSAYQGNFYIFEIPLLLFGVWLIFKFNDAKIRYFLLIWLLLAPIPAALSGEAPHGLRSSIMIPPLVILISLASANLIERWDKFKIALGTIVLVMFIINYLYSYYLLYPQRDNLSWAYGYRQLFKNLTPREKNYDRIIVTGYQWKPYIFYLFYNRTDPTFYQTDGSQLAIDKYRFGTTGWDGGRGLTDEEIERLKGNRTLLVVSPDELENLKDKGKFVKLTAISDYSGKKDVFVVGEWQ